MFNFFKTKPANTINSDSSETNSIQENVISQELFTSNEAPNTNAENNIRKDEVQDNNTIKTKSNPGIHEVFTFLQTDFETLGFNDALTNPDDAYRESREKELIENLRVTLVKTEIHYNDTNRLLDLHIRTRERAGLIDLVEELNIRKETISEHLVKIEEFKNELSTNSGVSQKIKLSYKHGFIKGLAAITVSTLLKPDHE